MPSMPPHLPDPSPSSRAGSSTVGLSGGPAATRTSIAPPPPTERARRALPLRPRASAYAWLTVLGLMLLASIPLLIGLRQQGSIDTREARAIATADETWRRQSSFGDDGWGVSRLVPVQSGQAVLDQPPGLTWMQMAAFAALPRGEASLDRQVLRARLIGVTMSLVTLGAIFWIGMSLGGLRTATFAAMVLLANPLLVLTGRLATAEAVTVGWVTLAMAAALWAIRPMRPGPKLWRQAAGWALCGASTGAALLCGGLIVLALVGLPLVVIAALCPRRMSHALGLLAAGSIAGLITLPWAVYLLQAEPDTWARLGALSWSEFDLRVAAETVGPLGAVLLLGMGAWVLLGLVGWVSPWTPGNREHRRRMLVGWVWAVCCGASLVLACFAATVTAGKLAVVALTCMVVTALLVAQTLSRCGDVARDGGLSRLWRALRWPTAGWVMALSLVGPILLYLRTAEDGQAHPWYWLGAAAVLGLLGFMGASWASRPYPGRAVACWSVWTTTAITLVAIQSSTLSPLLPHATHGTASLLNALDLRRAQAVARVDPASSALADQSHHEQPGAGMTTFPATFRQHDAP